MVDEIFEQNVCDSFSKYLGKSITELTSLFLIDSTSKNLFEMIVSRILGCQGKANQSIDIIRSNTIIKTIKLQENGTIKESMSFPTFDFKKIIASKWKDSDLRNMFLTQTFLFVVFSCTNNDVILSAIKFWKMPLDILEQDVRRVWEKTVEIIQSGNIVAGIKEQKNGKSVLKTNFPGISFSNVCHVRPHARNSDDTYELPYPDKMTGMVRFTKQCFWLNNTFIRDIIK